MDQCFASFNIFIELVTSIKVYYHSLHIFKIIQLISCRLPHPYINLERSGQLTIQEIRVSAVSGIYRVVTVYFGATIIKVNLESIHIFLHYERTSMSANTSRSVSETINKKTV